MAWMQGVADVAWLKFGHKCVRHETHSLNPEARAGVEVEIWWQARARRERRRKRRARSGDRGLQTSSEEAFARAEIAAGLHSIVPWRR